MSIQKIPKYDKQDINNVGVVSLAIRPNQPSQYGVGSLTGKQLQERFDKLATTAIDKINAVIDILNGKDVAEHLRLGEAFGEDKSIKDMIADIYSATDGLVTTDPETAAKKAVKDILEDFYNGIIDLEAFTEIGDFDEGKKLSEIYATQAALTAHNTADGTHTDIRDSIPAAITAHNTADGTHTDIRNSIPAAITAHNTADGTHTDIRNSIPAAITAHNTATDAHSALRESITDAATDAATAAVGTGISNHNEDENAHSDIRTALTNLKTAVEHFLNIKDEDSLDQLSEIITYIENNKTLIDGITTSKVNVADIVNNLESTAENQPLSAQMGKTLNDNKLDKFVNDSRVSKVYGVGPKNDPKQQMFISKSGFEGDETYDSVPMRSAYNNAKHPGTFEIEHPIMDTNSTAYSEKHPVTVQTLINYVAEHGGGGGGTGYVTTEEFEAFKDELTYKPIKIESFSPDDSIFEKGQTVTSVTLRWSLNAVPKTQKLDGETVSGRSKTFTGSWKSATSWRLDVTDEKGASDYATTSIDFYSRVYYGTSSYSSIGEEVIKSFTGVLRGNKESSIILTADEGEYIYYCHPTSYGLCGFIDAFTGFPYAFEAPQIVSVTNAFGYTENYYVYRSTYAIKGKAKITVT